MTSEKRKKSYWLLKTEPEAFSFDDLIACPNKTDSWDGIRNYQARNLIRDDIKIGDSVFIYHSRIKDPAIVGIAIVSSDPYPDDSALDPESKYFDEKSAKLGESRWVMMDVKASKRFSNPIPISKLRTLEPLDDLPLLKKGQRLSVQPVPQKCWEIITKLEKIEAI